MHCTVVFYKPHVKPLKDQGQRELLEGIESRQLNVPPSGRKKVCKCYMKSHEMFDLKVCKGANLIASRIYFCATGPCPTSCSTQTWADSLFPYRYYSLPYLILLEKWFKASTQALAAKSRKEASGPGPGPLWLWLLLSIVLLDWETENRADPELPALRACDAIANKAWGRKSGFSQVCCVQ